MNLFKKKIYVIIIVALLLMPVVHASAATKVFFSNTISQGFSCTAYGTISATVCHLSFSATALPTTPVQPWETHTSTIHAITYSSAKAKKSDQNIIGDCTCDAYLHSGTDWHFGYVECDFRFDANRVGLPKYNITN